MSRALDKAHRAALLETRRRKLTQDTICAAAALFVLIVVLSLVN